MKILHTVKRFSPNTGGMYEVVKQLSTNLADKGHYITIVSLPLSQKEKENIKHPNIKIIEFNIKGNYQEGFYGDVKKYHNFLKNSNYDIMTNFSAQNPISDSLLEILPQIKTKKIFVPTGFNAINQKIWQKYFKKMPQIMKEYDINIILSKEQEDMKFAKKHRIKNIVIIPNGASKKEFSKEKKINIRKKLNIPKNNFFILNISSHTGFKGHAQAIKIFSKAKIRSATLLIAGNTKIGGCEKKCKKLAKKYNKSFKFKKNKKNIIIKHLNREEILSAYKEANIFLFPSNIECSPLVLFECLASNLFFLSTDVGNAKEIVEITDGGLILPTLKNVPAENNFLNNFKSFVKKLLEIVKIGKFHSNKGFVRAKINKSAKILENCYNNPKKIKSLSNLGHKYWLKYFTWEKIAEDYENIYKNLIKTK